MSSLYDELSEKLKKEPSVSKGTVARFDMTLLMFNARESVRELWNAADAEVRAAATEGRQPPASLASAVEKLRPIFGERA